jgi:hypothetical protein
VNRTIRTRHRSAAALTVVATVALVATTVIPAAALFEDLALSPRARALGEATTVTLDDPWAFHYNPAMLVRLAEPQLGMATVRPNGLGFNRLTGAALAAPLRGRTGTLAVGWRRYGVEYGGVDLATENTLSVAHAFRLFGDASTSASLGWTLHMYHAEFAPSIGPSASAPGTGSIDPGGAWTFGIDVGALVTVYDRTRVGFFTRNLNSPTIGEDEEELRQLVAVGIAYEPYPGVTTAVDLRNSLGEDARFSGGMEFEVVPGLDLRAGLETGPNKITGGAGLHLPYLSLDYGFSTGGGVLDASHHFGVGLSWDRRRAEAGP